MDSRVRGNDDTLNFPIQVVSSLWLKVKFS
jgi:hypothetical protein